MEAAGVFCLGAILVLALAGCAENSLVLKGQVDRYKQEQTALAQQKDELQGQASNVRQDNEQLHSVLAQQQQQNKLLQDRLALLQSQLASTNEQLARAQDENKAANQKVQTLTASMHRQGGVAITPNNSFAQSLPAINLPDVFVRRDGDVIRVELPSQRLFQAGNAQLLPEASQMIATAAAELVRSYPNQILGVEGHTDSSPLANAQWRNNHQLSIGRAVAVYDVLVAQNRIPPSQLFLVGHGSNHPLYSNATPAGRQRNNRVELVVYPERGGGRD